VIKNPEIASLVPTLLKALTDPNDHTRYALDILLQVRFIDCTFALTFYALLFLRVGVVNCRLLLSTRSMHLRWPFWCPLFIEG